MSFADRLKKREPMPLAAEKPKYAGPMALCHPHVLTLDGSVVGLVSITMSAQLVAGVESTRLLTAIEELLAGRLHLDSPSFERELRELREAVSRHLNSLSAAIEQAEEEHEATHQHDRSAH